MSRNLLALLAVVSLCLVGCADHVTLQQAVSHEKIGFLFGLWHGMVLPFAWFGSLFDDSIAVYAIYNNGGWYDFGFVIGVGGLAGGSRSRS